MYYDLGTGEDAVFIFDEYIHSGVNISFQTIGDEGPGFA